MKLGWPHLATAVLGAGLALAGLRVTWPVTSLQPYAQAPQSRTHFVSGSVAAEGVAWEAYARIFGGQSLFLPSPERAARVRAPSPAPDAIPSPFGPHTPRLRDAGVLARAAEVPLPQRSYASEALLWPAGPGLLRHLGRGAGTVLTPPPASRQEPVAHWERIGHPPSDHARPQAGAVTWAALQGSASAPLELPPQGAAWEPVCFLLLVQEGRLIGLPLLEKSSGIPEWDRQVRGALAAWAVLLPEGRGYLRLTLYP